MAQLSNKTLDGLPNSVERPRYDRNALTPGMVHVGIGAFHRAHQAVYTDAILERDPGWCILAASTRRGASSYTRSTRGSCQLTPTLTGLTRTWPSTSSYF